MRYSKWKRAAIDGLQKFVADKQGVTALEYALIAGVVVVIVSALLPGIGVSVTNMWNNISNTLA